MSIFVLNMPFAIEKRIFFSALSSKMNRRFVLQNAMRIKQNLPTYNAPIYLRTECSEHKKRRGPNKKNPRVQIWFIICAANFIRIAIDAGNFDAPFLDCLHRILNVKVMACSFCWRERKRKYDFYSKAACSNCK
jgi:hypothetical protein